jgi:hypothetical protein
MVLAQPARPQPSWAAPPAPRGLVDAVGASGAGPLALPPALLPPAAQHAVRRLAAQYEQWEAGLRCEAEERIGGFRPLHRFLEASGMPGEEWGVLRHIKRGSSGDGAGAPPPPPSPAGGAGDAGGGAMKRPASEGTLAVAEQPARVRRVALRPEWEPLDILAPGADARAAAAAPPPPDGLASPTAAAAAPPPSPASPSRPCFPRVPTAPSLRAAGDAAAAAASEDAPSAAAAPSPRPAAAAPAPALFGGDAPATAGEPRDGLGPRSGSSGQLEAVAARLLQSSRAALQSAGAAVAETATNCSHNFQSLGALLSASMTAGPGSSGALTALAAAPWAGAGAGAPAWGAGGGVEEILPPYMRGAFPGSLSTLQLCEGDTSSSGECGGGAAAAGPAGGASPAAAAYRQVLQYFDRLEEERRRRRRAAAGGAYSSLKEPGRNVAIVTTASLPWCAPRRGASGAGRLGVAPPARAMCARVVSLNAFKAVIDPGSGAPGARARHLAQPAGRRLAAR